MSATAPAVRKPAFSLSFGSGSTDDWARSLATVSVEAGLAPAVDVAEVVLSSRDDAPKVALADTGDVSLGFDDDSPDAVFKGAVRAVHHTVSGKTRVVASNGGAVLAAFRLDQGYEQQSAGDIVRDLAGKDGRRHRLDRRRPLAPLLRRRQPLTRLGARREARGALRLRGLVRRGRRAPLRPAPGGLPAQTFTYGQDILELDALEAPPLPGSVKVVGEGAAGSQGSDAWSWNVKDSSSVTGTAGSGDPAVLVQLGALRSADAVSGAAQGSPRRRSSAPLTARLLVPGAPKAAVGSTVAVASAPDDTLNGSWVVRGVRHRLVKARGYTSLLLLAKGDT